jgi:alkylated DNA repair dioxygenase AlkB
MCQPEQSIRLESGDVLLFGGPNRLVEHCVLRVHENTCPKFLPLKGVSFFVVLGHNA